MDGVVGPVNETETHGPATYSDLQLLTFAIFRTSGLTCRTVH